MQIHSHVAAKTTFSGWRMAPLFAGSVNRVAAPSLRSSQGWEAISPHHHPPCQQKCRGYGRPDCAPRALIADRAIVARVSSRTIRRDCVRNSISNFVPSQPGKPARRRCTLSCFVGRVCRYFLPVIATEASRFNGWKSDNSYMDGWAATGVSGAGRARFDFAAYAAGLCDAEVIIILQVHPELRGKQNMFPAGSRCRR